jgi:unsaturated rhamnogalacturonyl hydrolase
VKLAGPLGLMLAVLAVAPPPAPPSARPPSAGPMAVRLADAVLARWPDPLTLSEKGWEYTNGIVLRGIAEVYRTGRDPRYLDYVRRWVDAYLRPDGTVAVGEAEHNFDRIQPGNLLLFLHEETGEARYEKAARFLRVRFDTIPKGAFGGYWHKQKYPQEMWLDSIYMGLPFLVRFGKRFGEPGFCFDTAVRQAALVGEHTRVGETGLFRHAWDQDKNAAWADPATGISPVVWGRAMGWYLMALVDILDDLPADHPGRPRLLALFREGTDGILRVQDPASGLWYQVLDQPALPGNWLETSASAMFVYALERGATRGYLDARAREAARRGWDGLRTRLTEDADGRPNVEGAVEGMSVLGSAQGYLEKRRLRNSPHGLCGMLLAASQMDPARPASR